VSYSYRVYGEGHLADTLRCELDLQPLDLRLDRHGPNVLAFVAQDVTEHSEAQLAVVATLLDNAHTAHGYVVLLSQVPPGWTRAHVRRCSGVFYQVDTIIVRHAVERMMRPEQFVIGCADPSAPLPLVYQEYLALHDCPVLQMSYESAELAKCAINYLLMKQIEAANDISAAAEACMGDYADVERALHNDARVGPHAYLRPGVINQHLSRDVQAVRSLIAPPLPPPSESCRWG